MGTISETIKKYFSQYDEDESEGTKKKVYKKKKKKKDVKAGSYFNKKKGSDYEKALEEAGDY